MTNRTYRHEAAAGPGGQDPAQAAVGDTVGDDPLGGDHGEHAAVQEPQHAARPVLREPPGGPGQGPVPADGAPVAPCDVGDRSVVPEGDRVPARGQRRRRTAALARVRPAGASGRRAVGIDRAPGRSQRGSRRGSPGARSSARVWGTSRSPYGAGRLWWATATSTATAPPSSARAVRRVTAADRGRGSPPRSPAGADRPDRRPGRVLHEGRGGTSRRNRRPARSRSSRPGRARRFPRTCRFPRARRSARTRRSGRTVSPRPAQWPLLPPPSPLPGSGAERRGVPAVLRANTAGGRRRSPVRPSARSRGAGGERG